jgi:hypothetical protein
MLKSIQAKIQYLFIKGTYFHALSIDFSLKNKYENINSLQLAFSHKKSFFNVSSVFFLPVKTSAFSLFVWLNGW